MSSIRTSAGPLSKKFLDFVEAVDQAIHFLRDIIQIEAGARGGRQPITVVQRHRAMVTGPNGDAVTVQYLGNVMRVHALEREGCHPASPISRRAVHFDA